MLYNKIFPDKLVEKLKKIPVFVWYIVFGLASLFASTYSLIATNNEIAILATEMMPEVNVNVILALSYPFLMLFEIVIFEFIAYLLYSILYNRFLIKITQFDFVFRLRLIMIVAYIIIGIISLIYFAFPQAVGIGTSILNVGITTLILGFFLFAMCKDHIPNNKEAQAYKYVARLYLGIYLALSVFSFILLFAFPEDVNFMEYLTYGIRIIALMLLSLFAYFQYQKLKKIPPKDTNDDKKEQKNESVYKDFGF